MSIVRIEEEIQPLKYLVITQIKDPESVITTNVVISDNRLNKINLLSIEKGPQGDQGLQGLPGPAGADGVVFDVLSIGSGGTNNTSYTSGNIIYFDGEKLSSSTYTIDTLLDVINSTSAITGISSGSGLYRNTIGDNSIELGINIGDGLTLNDSNIVVVDDTVVRKVELSIGNISGIVPIAKGGTNNQTFSSNRLLYFDGSKISSFPLATGRILLSGTTIDIVAGSGLIGGGPVSLPSGSVVLNIGGSEDILVETNTIRLSNTGIPGIYSKITTDDKGRVISGSNLTTQDIINILGYIPWGPNNDGENSGLDADKLDGFDSTDFFNLVNHTGILNPNSLPVQSTPGTFTKVSINNKGIVINGSDIIYQDIVNALGYRPISNSGDSIDGPLVVNGDVTLNTNNVNIRDNLITIGTNSQAILPSEPRGFSFLYGGATPRTGLLAYFPTDRELRLITNITNSTNPLNGGGADDVFNEDVDGGDATTIYVYNNVSGDAATVLMRQVADQIYVSRTATQIVSGLKTFADRLTVDESISIRPRFGQSTPPLSVGSNTRLVENLNVDLLDDEHGSYYLNANNMTGLFDYEKVTFNNLEGTPNYIPVFDDRTNNPSRTISNSNILQSSNSIRVLADSNVFVGATNSGTAANRSLLVGSQNIGFANNGLAIGTSNIVSGNNSIALNNNSKAIKDNSIAAGTAGYTWSNNQIAVGAFIENSDGQTLSQGQYSTIALGLASSQTEGSFVSMSPSVTIPKNKTIAYSLEVLLNKSAGTGAALFVFDSGIIKNTTYRDSSNLSTIKNITSILKNSKKEEIYNDSQQRRHYYHYSFNDNNTIQNLDVTAPPLKYNPLIVQNVDTLYKYTPQYKSLSGIYYKLHNGELILELEKPLSSGWFIQSLNDNKIYVKSYDHGLSSGVSVSTYFSSGFLYKLPQNKYTVTSIVDKDSFYLNHLSWGCLLSGDMVIVKPSSLLYNNNIEQLRFSGSVVTNGSQIYNIDRSVEGILFPGMEIKYGPVEYPGLEQTGVIASVSGPDVSFSPPFTGTFNNNSISGPGYCEVTNYSKYIFQSNSDLRIDLGAFGYHGVTVTTTPYNTVFCDQPTIAFNISGLLTNFTGIDAEITPVNLNSGILTITPHRTVSGTYDRAATSYKKYEGVYTREPSISGFSTIKIYNKNLEPISLPSAPFNYQLICGHGDTDNDAFRVIKSGLYSYLEFKNNSIEILRTGIQPRYFFTALSNNLLNNEGYVFYPIKDNNDLSLLPSGIDPDITYYPTNILSSGGYNYFNLSFTFGGDPIQNIATGANGAYKLFPVAVNPTIKNNYYIRLKSYDHSGRSYEKPFVVHVDNIEIRNNVKNSIPNQYAIVNQPYIFQIASNTFPNNVSGYIAMTTDGTNLPSWLNFNASALTFSGTPTINDLTSFDILVRGTGENLSVSDVFKLQVVDNQFSISNYFSDPYQSFDIIDFNLSNVIVPKNLSYDTIIGKFNTNGGYNPYLIFETSSNSFRGNAHSGSRVLTESVNVSGIFPTTTINSALTLLESGNPVTISYVSDPNIITNKTINKIISPISFSATFASGTEVLSISSVSIPAYSLVSGNRLFSSLEGWNNQTRVISVTPQQIILDRVPIVIDQPSLEVAVSTSGYNTLIDTAIDLSGFINSVFTTPLNSSGNYYIDNLQFYTTTGVNDAWCPQTTIDNSNVKGFYTLSTKYLSANTGYYSTGLISFYTDVGHSIITVYPDISLNLEPIEDSTNVKFLSTNTGLLPSTRTYSIISGLDESSFLIDNTYLFPNIQKACTGALVLNLEQNHGYRILSNNALNQVPVKFENAIENNSNRVPKNNLYDIIAISGNKLKLYDGDNYLLKETNEPDYFEQPIYANYITNGFHFSGLLVSGSPYIFNCTTNSIFDLDPQMLIGCHYSNWRDDAAFLRAQNYIYMSGSIASGTNRVFISPTGDLASLPEQIQIFSNDPLWGNEGYRTLIAKQSALGFFDIDSELESFSGTRTFALYSKPYIQLDQPVCLVSSNKTYDRLYFNGNILSLNNFSTPRSYLQDNDQIKILQWNNSNIFNTFGISRNVKILNQNNRQTSLTGIAIGGDKTISPKELNSNTLLKENEFRHVDPLGLGRDIELPCTGTVSFVGAVSGHCSIPFSNNIYYHTHGDSTATWPADPSGIYVKPPLTGIYFINTNVTSCNSGYLCLTIHGFGDTRFDNIEDISPRNSLGKLPTTIVTDSVVGSLGPLPLKNKKLYFDFSDDAPELNGSYFVNQKINPSIISINIPYNFNYLNRSGLVYIIDSDYNIKSHRNPNLDNTFNTVNGNVVIKEGNASLSNYVNYYIDSYNSKAKRWKHLVHLNKDINNYGGYDITFGEQIDAQLISLSPEVIKFNSIEYSFDSGATYTNLNLISSNINLLSNTKAIYLKIFLKDGSGRWDTEIQKCAPRINIYGVGEYIIDSDNIIFNPLNQQWIITVVLSNLNHIYDNRSITIRASDESGFVEHTIVLNTIMLPSIPSPSGRFVLQNDSNGWVLPFDIKYLPDPNSIVVSLTGYPGPDYTSYNDILSTGTKVFTGPVGNNTGIFNPVLTIKDYITNETLASQTGQITVLSLDSNLPYSINLEDLPDDIYLNMGPYYGNNTASFEFHIPAVIDTAIGPTITFDSSSFYGINHILEYSSISKRYRVTAIVTGVPGYYPNKNINVAISQPQYDENDQLYWERYQLSKPINLTLYRDININTIELNQPVLFNTEEPWSINFKIDDGLWSHRPDVTPRVKIANLTNIGNYESQPLEYTLVPTFDNVNKKWNFNITAKRDIFGEYTRNLGLHTLKIYAEDNVSFSTGYIRLNFVQIPYLDNLRNLIYSTPDNAYVSSVDIKQFGDTLDQPPPISFPGNLKENTISLNKYHNKYDYDLKLWEYSYSGSPITEQWDVNLSLSNINTLLSNDQYSTLTVRCKGIASDKIQAVGKLSLIELDSNSITSTPLQIINLTTPSYQVIEGSPWSISFSTIGGLENPNYPPTILLSGMPSACSGFDPKIPLVQQNSCLKSREWNANTRRWDFEFEGLPLCGQQGLKPFTVTAIDTDTTQNLYLDIDFKTSAIEYLSLESAGIDHPTPQIINNPGQENEDPIRLTPLCSSSINKVFKFGVRNREQCPIPTGLTGWIVSGQLPSGLDYTINFPGTLLPPWNNLSSGTLTIFGEPLAFASGGDYNEKLYLTVYDARNKSATKEFKFIDTSTANPPSPINYTVYFDDIGPAFTKRLDRQSDQPINTVNLSGTAPVDYNQYSNILTYRPAPHPSSLLCTSRLPHNQCLRSIFAYSGGDYLAGDSKVYITNSKYGLSANDQIYLEFDNNSNNGEYFVNITGDQAYINVVGHQFTTGSGVLVRAIYDNIFTKELHRFQGSVDTISSNGILGCGSFKYKNISNDDGYGIFGRLMPSFIASIPSSGAFVSSDSKLSGLTLSVIPEYSNYPSVYTIKTSTCWETGYYRISGIVLPRPSVELTDPPPAAATPFSYNNQAYSVLSRVVYGNSEFEKNREENYRAVGVNYLLKNCTTNSGLLNGSVSTSTPSAGGGQSIVFNNSLSSGAILSIKLWNNPDNFPTYVYSNIPYTENEYFWIHKGGDRDEIPNQSSFPPIIVTGIGNTINAISGISVTGYILKCLGGYIPWSGNYFATPYYALSDGTPWTLNNYAPLISGIVQKDLNQKINTTYSYSPGSNSVGVVVNIPSGTFYPNNKIFINFPDNIVPDTGITLPSNFINTVILPVFPNRQQSVTGPAEIEGRASIVDIIGDEIFISHNNVFFKNGDYIDIGLDINTSTENRLLYSNTKLSIVSGDSSTMVATLSDSDPNIVFSGLSVGDWCYIRKNIYNKINIDQPSYIDDGQWSAAITGIPDGLYKNYWYRIITSENTGLPVFFDTGLQPKINAIDYPLYINMSPSIVLSEQIINSGIINNNGIWSFSFEIEGGQRPVYDYLPEVTINDSFCQFTRVLSTGMRDGYNQANDRLIVTLNSNNTVNYSWSEVTQAVLKVYDKTGMDTKTIYFNQP